MNELVQEVAMPGFDKPVDGAAIRKDVAAKENQGGAVNKEVQPPSTDSAEGRPF